MIWASSCCDDGTSTTTRRGHALPHTADTRGIAAEMLALLNEMPGVKAELHASSDRIHNVVARLKGGRPGPRLIFNGHLDTFPLSNRDEWTASPTGAVVGGKVYGLGISDMKGGLAASIFALQNLAVARSSWAGEGPSKKVP